MSYDLLLELVSFACLGGVAGILAGVFGIGGGMIMVPALFYLGTHFYPNSLGVDFLMRSALGTSFAVIIPTGMASSWAQYKRGAIDWSSVWRLGPGQVLGVALGVAFASFLGGLVLQLIFALGLYVLCFLMFRNVRTCSVVPALSRWWVTSPISFCIGFFSSLLGIGGAAMNIPFMTYGGLDTRRAIATASVLGVLVAVPATVGFILMGDGGVAVAAQELPSGFLGSLNLKAWAMIAPFSVVAAPYGVRWSHRLPVHRLRLGLALFLLAIATKMLLGALS